MNTAGNPDHDPLADEVTPLPAQVEDQCKDCQRFFPGVQLIPLAHGNVCHECQQQRHDSNTLPEPLPNESSR